MLITKEASTIALASQNWPSLFPYKPDVQLTLYHSDSMLHLHFRVKQDGVRSFCKSDKERGWEYSCVEFFFMPDGSEVYYNLECTCTGKIYLCSGKDRHGRVPLSDEAYASVIRTCSLGDEAFGYKEGECEWEVKLDVPASVYGLKSFKGCKGKGNFYSCGDGLPVRHYLSWAPIPTEKPDYHRPEYFETIEFV